MDNIFFEKQIGRLCAQHALNMLLQGQEFHPDDLARIAHELDDTEREMLAPHLRANFQSQNVDDSGFFSIQVIQVALRKYDLVASSLDRPSHAELRSQPSKGTAYICNLKEHWFTVRQFNGHWFILDSLRVGPTPISTNYLDYYFAQLSNEGYSIFVVDGELPVCSADLITEFTSPSPPPTLTARRGLAGRSASAQEDDDMARAIALSLSTGTDESGKSLRRQSTQTDDVELQKALEASLRDACAADEEARLVSEAIKQSLGGREPPGAEGPGPSSRVALASNGTISSLPAGYRITPSAPPLTTVASADGERVRNERIVPIKVEPKDEKPPNPPVTENGVNANSRSLSTTEKLANGHSTAFSAYHHAYQKTSSEFSSSSATSTSSVLNNVAGSKSVTTTSQDVAKMSREEEIRQKRLKYFDSLGQK